jgi:hypothetical protein
MERSSKRKAKRPGERSAAALQDMNDKLGSGRLERKAQASGRRFGRCSERAEEERHGVARLCGDREALQLYVARLRQPCRERMAASRAQRLLRRPERLLPAGRREDEQIREIEPGSGQCRRIGHVRRREPHDALAGAREVRKRRQHERELTDAALVSEELRESLARPPAAGQLGIEVGETAWQRGHFRGKAAAPPDTMPL